MRGPKPDPLSLSEAERTALEVLVRRHGTPQQVALRGRIILTADQGKNNSQIAAHVAVCVDTVRFWRKRWLGLQAVSLDDLFVSERLVDAPRPGRPSQSTAEQTCQMVALACEQPKERPISRLSGAAKSLMKSCDAVSSGRFRPSMPLASYRYFVDKGQAEL